MSRWKRYEEYLDDGLWHVHTDVTDGRNSIEEVLEFAVEQGVPFVAFAEHVRRSPTYDFEEFYRTATAEADARDLACAVGCEAKVVNVDGELDASTEILRRADLVYGAYHGTPFSRAEYLESAYRMLENPAVDVWAHPFVYARRNELALTEEEIDGLLEHAAANDVLVEYNLRYERDRPSDSIVGRALEEHHDLVGYDLHDIAEWDR